MLSKQNNKWIGECGKEQLEACLDCFLDLHHITPNTPVLFTRNPLEDTDFLLALIILIFPWNVS